MQLWSELASVLRRGERAVLVTVLQSQGSSPREAGSRMLVSGAGFRGTIGGGALEWRMLAKAEGLLARAAVPHMQVMDQVLGPDLGQCCGGRVRVLLESFAPDDLSHVAMLAEASRQKFKTAAELSETAGRLDRRIVELDPSPRDELLLDYDGQSGTVTEIWRISNTPVLLFGAGHVGRALALALAPLPFEVTWVDSRLDVFPSHVPQNVVTSSEPNPINVLIEASAGTLVVVMTHSHALDLEVVAAALSDDRFPFVGLIGSSTKRAHFLGRLGKIGVDAARLTCPIGLPEIGGKEPPVIAASVAAQLLVIRTELNEIKRPVLAEVAHA